METPVLSVVMPVFKEGDAVEPVLRALTAAVTKPHEILVVYDFDEDPTRPVIERLAAELPAVRGRLGQAWTPTYSVCFPRRNQAGGSAR